MRTITIGKKLTLGLLITAVIGSGCFLSTPDTDPTDFYIANNCDTVVVLKSSAVVRYSDGPKTEYREFTIAPKELFFLRSIGTTNSFGVNEVFKTFDVYLAGKISKCNRNKNEDWAISNPQNKKTYVYNVKPTCF